MSGANNVFEVFHKYYDNSIILVMVGMVTILFLYRTTKEKKIYFLTLGICLLLLFNQISYWVIKKIGEQETYYRFLWIIPCTILCAWLLIEIFEQLQSKQQKCALLLVVAIAFFVYGGNRLDGFLKLPENIYQIPQSLMDICDVIESDRKEKEAVIVFAETGVLDGAREYNAHINMVVEGDVDYLEMMMVNNYSNMQGIVIKAIIESSKIDYMVVANEDNAFLASVMSAGCTVVGNTGEYTILNTHLDEIKAIFERYDKKDFPSEIATYFDEDVYVGTDDVYEFVYYPDNHVALVDSTTGENIHLLQEDKEFQLVEYEKFILCAINTDDDFIEAETVHKMKELSKSGKKIIVLLTNPIYQEGLEKQEGTMLFGENLDKEKTNASELIEAIKKEDNNIVAVFSCGMVVYRKLMLNNNIWQCVCVDDNNLGTVIRVK